MHEDLKTDSMKVYVCTEPDAADIIEGVPVLTVIGDLAQACRLLFELTYAQNLQYPSKLGKSFEVFQRLFVGLETLRPKPSTRFISLKNRLLV